MNNLDNIVGAPYLFPPNPPESFDCWTLLVYVREQLGLDTPVHLDVEDYSLHNMAEAVALEKASGDWKQVDTPQDGDAVLFSPDHIGVSMGPGVLHAHAPSKTVVYTRWNVVRRRWPLAEVFRP